jgi:uncharacterized protein (TIGR02391 family)
MATLRQLVSDADTLVAMHPADLAGYVLEALMTAQASERALWNRRNFCMSAGQEYSKDMRQHGPDSRVSEACATAWSWLTANWLICEHPEQDNWYIPTERGKSVRDRAGVRALVEGEELPDHFLHDDFIKDVRPLFLQGRYDLTVFEAFHRLEIAIREASALSNELLGTKLAARAFHPEDGPLTDTGADAGERQALMNLMSGALGSYKNPQSHRHVGLDASEAREMLLMASHLLKIVASRRTRRE